MSEGLELSPFVSFSKRKLNLNTIEYNLVFMMSKAQAKPSIIYPQFSLEANGSELQSWKTRAERSATERSHKNC
jgi:hypothetical protein